MYFGSITHPNSGVSGKYTYMRRGTDTPLFPDLKKEEITQGYIDLQEGNIFQAKSIGWRWTTIMDIGIDILVELDRACYIDRIVIEQDKASAIKDIKILDTANDNLSCIGSFHSETDNLIEGRRLDVLVGAEAKELIIRLEAHFEDISIDSIDILGAVLDEFSVFPLPQSINIKDKVRGDIIDIENIIISDNPSEDTLFAANLLKEKLYENHNIDISIADFRENSSNSILIGTPTELKEDVNIKTDGYILDTTGDVLNIIADDRRGLIYGLESFLQLTMDGQIPSCTIEDHPFMPIRGAHFGLPPKEEIPFLKRLVRYVLAPMGYNTIYLEFAGGMRYDSHPKISKAWEEGNKKADEGLWPPVPHGSMVAGGSLLEKDEVRDLVDYMRSYGIDVIPEVQSLGHVQYITMAYPEIAETKDRIEEDGSIDLNIEDKPPSEFYYGSYCPSNERSYEIIFDLIDEIVEVVKPREYVHMGHDEVYVIGTCPVCKHKNPAKLLATHLNRLHEHLAKKDLKMMIWADMLQNVTRYKTPEAINMVPKDIVLLDFIWYFHTDKDIENYLLDHGFKVMMGNMYSSHYPRFEKRIRQEGMIGGEVSTWKRVDEYNLGFEGKIYDFLYSGNMFWSPSYSSELRYSYDNIISSKLIPHVRSRLGDRVYPSLQAGKKEYEISMPKSNKGLKVPCQLLERLKENEGVQHVALGDSVKILVEDRFDSLVFKHTTGKNAERIAWEDPKQIGLYKVKFVDGDEVEIPLEYGGNICVWNRRHNSPMTQPYYRHQGYIGTYFADPYIKSKTEDGEDVTVYSYEWINPQSDKKIESVELISSDDTDASIILCGIKGIKV